MSKYFRDKGIKIILTNLREKKTGYKFESYLPPWEGLLSVDFSTPGNLISLLKFLQLVSFTLDRLAED